MDEVTVEQVVALANARRRYRYGEARTVWLASTCEDRRVCTDCLVEQALDEFHRSDRGRRMTVCRACRLRKQKAYRAGLSSDRRDRNRLGMVAWRFGLTSEAVAQILVQQRNRCAICNRLMKRGRGVEGANLDHKCVRDYRGAFYARSATSRSATSSMSSDFLPSSWRR